MKGIIATLNSKYIHSSLSVWCLFTACREYCKKETDIKVIEGTINERNNETKKKILAERPDFVALGLYIWNKNKILKLAKSIKQALPDTIIIIGGPEAAYNQSELLNNHSYIDYILSGEGEIVLPELIDCISEGLLPYNIEGISFVHNGSLAIKSEALSERFDFPSPYCEEYFQALNGRLAYIESSRGCPFNCAYCLSGRCGKVKFKDIEQTKREILLLSASGAKTVKFVDRTFNCHSKRSCEILRFIIDNHGKSIPDGVCFHFEISADILTDEFVNLVKLAPKGLFQFEIGIQSMNPATLKAIGRKSDIDKLCSNIRSLVSAKTSHIHTDLIAGLPEETKKSFEDAFNKSYALGTDMLQLGFLKLLHGSPLRERGQECEFSSEPPYEIISTPTMTKEDLAELHIIEKEVDRLHNSSRFRRSLAYAIESSRLSPYEFFLYVGQELEKKLGPASVHLDAYINALFDIMTFLEGVDTRKLRDMLVTDRLASNSSGVIPECLYIEDDRLRQVKHLLSKNFPASKGINRSVAILYTKRNVIYCDYDLADAVTKEYRLRYLPFEFFGETFFNFDIDK